jgi:streptogramin lyase
MKNRIIFVLALVGAINSALSTAFAQGSAFALYVANNTYYGANGSRSYTVEEFDSQGNAGVFATNTSSTNPILSGPVAVAADSSGHVYVDCTQDNNWIEEFDSSGSNAVRFVNSSTLNYPAGMVFDGSGNLYVANNRFIERYDSLGNGTVFATTGVAMLEGLAFDSVGTLWVTDEYNGLIQKCNTNGTLTTFATPGHNPYGLAFDGSGNLYVALFGNGTIVKYDSNTNQTLVAALGGSAEPVGLAFDLSGNLYVAEYGPNRIAKIDPQFNVTVFATNGLNGPLFLAIQQVAPTLAITLSDNQAIVSWPSSVSGWKLQTNNNLATTNWGDYLGVIVNNTTTDAPSKGNLFFRLTQP